MKILNTLLGKFFSNSSPQTGTGSKGSLLLLFAALGMTGYLSFSPDTQYLENDLVSDDARVATTVDSNLVNPWGMAQTPSGLWWVVNNGKGIATLHDGNGQPYPLLDPLVVTVPAPAGVID